MPAFKDIPEVLSKLEYGVYIVTMGKGSAGNGYTASWLTQVSSEPPMIVMSVNNRHYSSSLLQENDCFAVNLLSQHSEGLAKMFYGPSESWHRKLSDVVTRPGPKTGSPLIHGAIGYLDCRVVKRVPAGNHTVYFGEILAAELNDDVGILTSSSSRLRYAG